MRIYPKKSLGQNFLKSKQVVRSIVTTADIGEHETILEIGPGKGILTNELLAQVGHPESSGKVIAIEKDDALAPLLAEKFAAEIASGKLVLIHDDILKWDPQSAGLSNQNFKIVANIPYYITGIVIPMFLDGNYKDTSVPRPSRIVLMVQKEVADRIVARDNKESLLSISVKAFGTPRYIEKVPAKYFSPEPNVDSAILLIENISNDFFKTISKEKFFNTLHRGFAHKRKQLARNLVTDSESKEKIIEALRKAGISDQARAEDVTLMQWKELVQFLTEIRT